MAREIDFGIDGLAQNKRLAYILYQIYGYSGVIDAVNNNVIDSDRLAFCMGCESSMPFMDNECLCCGQGEWIEYWHRRKVEGSE